MATKIPRGVHLASEAKKGDHKHESKDSAAAGGHKPLKENLTRKNIVHKGISTRYGQQAELKERNENLVSANEQLKLNVSEMQNKVVEMELQLNQLKMKNVEIEKNLKDSHAVLVAAKIDPVLGEKVGEAEQQKEDQRKEVMSASRELLNELKSFSDAALEQLARLDEIQTTMKKVSSAREHMLQEREDFSMHAKQMEEALIEAESLLQN
ncbi:small kinetochore-associated protein [Gouania willdenowi]|uniref:Uncharacterized LOC114458010 n=1 Tax=Gouania willdenowi TaxID=441366 RepID=A0A8C5H5Q4_GOUWI|nr:uncharacterized protein LOC114458010 [Gouania willdenowi]